MRAAAGILGASIALAPAAASQAASEEARYYEVDYLTAPDGVAIEVGGMDFMPDGRLVVSTRRGEVWMIEDPLAEDPADAGFSLFADGLWEGLGLSVVHGEIFLLQRGELSLLRDVDEDGLCDDVYAVCDDWGLSGNYHEFAYGLPVTQRNSFFIGLNVSFFSPKWWHGKSPVPYRGWILKIAPDGVITPWASGLRSPAGLALSPEGELFATDNQGDWMAASPIFHVKEGGFYGHPASLAWTDEYRESQAEVSDTIPPARAADREPAAIWLPYAWSRSPGNLVWDETGGAFGPFEGDFFLAELTNGMVLRGGMERVQGEYQGWVAPFRHGVGSSFRVTFAEDGTLFCGFTNRGWGGLAPADGIGRIRWTGETPLEIANVSVDQVGFWIDFTKPLLVETESERSVEVVQYDYDYWWEYGSPERALEELEVESIEMTADQKTLFVRTPDLRPGKVVRLDFEGWVAQDGSPLLHEEVAYTVNQLPEGPKSDEHVSKIVPPPPARESGEEGWLRLTYGVATDGWTFEGWELSDAALDPDDPTRFALSEGSSALVNTGPNPSHYVSDTVFGDARITLDFMLPEGGRSGVLLMGRYEILLADRIGGDVLGPEDCAAVAGGEGFPVRPPVLAGYRGAGQVHGLDVEFQAPRFDANGRKVENARLLRVKIDDVLLHENVELPGPTTGSLAEGPTDEVPLGPLVLRGDAGLVAFGDVRVRPRVEPMREEGWVPLFDGESLEGWTISEDGTWYVEDGAVVGEGPRSHLFSPRGDYEDFEVRARVKINEGGNSGLYFRVAATDEGWPSGYEAQINSSFADPQKTGSLYALSPRTVHLIPPDTWFDYHVTCRDEPEGTRISIRVNGVVVNEHLDTERRHASGHIALQQHHDGSVIEVKDLQIREL